MRPPLDRDEDLISRHDCRVTHPRRPFTRGTSARGSRTHGWTVLIGLLIGLIGGVAGPATPASAHAVLVSTTPLANTIVAAPPIGWLSAEITR